MKQQPPDPLYRARRSGHNAPEYQSCRSGSDVLIIAYIDPSAGGMLMQLLLGGTAGILVIGRLFWSRIRRLFGRPEHPDDTPPPRP
jgi:hypothetical protein